MFEPDKIRIDPLGESAYILRDLGEAKPYALAHALAGVEGVQETIPSYETVGVFVGPEFKAEDWPQVLAGIQFESLPSPKSHVVPVCYTVGPDLEEAAEALGISQGDLVQLHSSETYTCYAVGFVAAFPFLGYLREELQGLPRKSSPRPRVPVGSVGVTGKQTGIYPSESPGGWNLIGRTPLCLVDVAEAYFPISAGDTVRFVPIDEIEFERLEGERL